MSRDPLDRYYTPDPLAEILVSLLPIGPDVECWEPAAGGGAFVRALRQRGATVLATDIDPEAKGARDGVHDFLLDPGDGLEDWIITNPPEQQGSHTAVRWCEQAIRLSRVGAALLVRSAVYPRLSQMAEDHCIARYALQQRPEFGGPAREGKGPGARYDYDFLIFSKLRLGPAVSRRLSWR